MHERTTGIMWRLLEKQHEIADDVPVMIHGYMYFFKVQDKCIFRVIEGEVTSFYVDIRKVYVEFIKEDPTNIDALSKIGNGNIPEYDVVFNYWYKNKAYKGYGILLLEVDFENIKFRCIDRLSEKVKYTQIHKNLFDMSEFKEFLDTVGGSYSYLTTLVRCATTYKQR